MVLNRADECRQRADECRRGAAQAADDVPRVTYLDLARRWRKMAHEAESLERKAMAPTKRIPRRASVRPQRFAGRTSAGVAERLERSASPWLSGSITGGGRSNTVSDCATDN